MVWRPTNYALSNKLPRSENRTRIKTIIYSRSAWSILPNLFTNSCYSRGNKSRLRDPESIINPLRTLVHRIFFACDMHFLEQYWGLTPLHRTLLLWRNNKIQPKVGWFFFIFRKIKMCRCGCVGGVCIFDPERSVWRIKRFGFLLNRCLIIRPASRKLVLKSKGIVFYSN